VNLRRIALLALLLVPGVGRLVAQPFQLPTANRAVLDPDGGQERYFVGTVGKPWTSGRFGCVRTDGFQLHEGVDIRPLDRDRRGEPTDPARCAAEGVVAYVNTKPSLSNYGNYVVVRHKIDQLEVFTLYAHLASVKAGIKAGTKTQPGDVLGVMGRTSNTRQRITPDRAHLHFEILFMANSRYSEWHRGALKGTRNDHGDFNGRNLMGIDPVEVYRIQSKVGSGYDLVRHLGGIPELCRVVLRQPNPDWVRRNRGAVRPNPKAERDGIAGWELALGFNGVPLHATPRSRQELEGPRRNALLTVNPVVAAAHPCGKIVVRRGQSWELTNKGSQLLELLAY
jgi:peptidoglycan LD-endopeptidase LytH